ncbi:hypothetical protein B0H10DRAFT_501119 [Mycena sp. CBHHK59/15]|nr:hypothetical protein B0H10DRAFT_501119 [Mycena sp. CBHHK59/15]
MTSLSAGESSVASPSISASGSSTNTSPGTLSASSSSTNAFPSIPAENVTQSASRSSGGTKVPIAAIVGPILVLLALGLAVILLLWRRRRHSGNPFDDPENSSSLPDLPPISLNIDPFDSTTTQPANPPLLYPSEKSFPSAPVQPQVSPEQLQNAIGRIQEMYGIIQQMQNSSSVSGDDRTLFWVGHRLPPTTLSGAQRLIIDWECIFPSPGYLSHCKRLDERT